MPVVLWVRAGDPECGDAQRFLRANRYVPDAVHDVGAQPPAPAQILAAGRGAGSLQALCDARHPRWRELASEGADALGEERLVELLARHGELIRVPVLVTPKGTVAGFRERRWRDFLDIGKGRD